jgi:tripartite-type tricarboxylate transporter receptor subunit TctC
MQPRSIQAFPADTAQKDAATGPFELENDRLLEVKRSGRVRAKVGSMVARIGAVKFTREGRGEGNTMQQRRNARRAGLCRTAGVACLAAAASGAGTVAAAHAQGYPNRPVRFIVAQTAGGNADLVARAFGQKLSERLGQQFVVDNRPGGGGVIASELVARAAPDGHTLLLAPTSHGINPNILPKLPYDHKRDFAPVSLLAAGPNILVVNPSVPAKTVPELIALARARNGTLRYGSSGIAGSPHLAAELFKQTAKVDMTHIPYKGAPAAMVDLVSGQIELSFASPPSALPLLRSGKLRGIAVTSPKRFAAAPELPTVAETLPGFETSLWQSMLAPAKTPAAIIALLHREVAAIARMPEIRDRLLLDGSEVVGSTPQELAAHIDRELARWAGVIRTAGLRNP